MNILAAMGEALELVDAFMKARMAAAHIQALALAAGNVEVFREAASLHTAALYAPSVERLAEIEQSAVTLANQVQDQTS